MKYLAILLCLALTACKSSDKEITRFVVYYGNDSLICDIGDSTITGLFPVNLNKDSLVTVKYRINDQRDSTEQIRVDIPTWIFVMGEDSTWKKYQVIIQSFNGLPIVSINTNNVAIADKINYIPGTITVDGNTDSIRTYPMGIRGRGNTTWLYGHEPKNPYKFKLTDKASLFGFPADKEWALIANWFDMSLLRNDVAMELSTRLGAQWTPRRKPVDVFLNRKYNGSYLLMETIKASKDRVNLAKDGWLIEINHNAPEDDTRFYIADSTIDPNLPADVKEGAVKSVQIKHQLDSLWNILHGAPGDYTGILDLDSYVTWFLVNEVMVNNDAFFYSSVYMQRDSAKGKIKMGPVWDFDLSSGNFPNSGNDDDNGTAWRMPRAQIANMIWKDSTFKAALKSKWVSNRTSIMTLPDYITKKGNDLLLSGDYDAAWWLDQFKGSRHMSRNPHPGTHMSEVNFLKDWMDRRVHWMDSAITILK